MSVNKSSWDISHRLRTDLVLAAIRRVKSVAAPALEG